MYKKEFNLILPSCFLPIFKYQLEHDSFVLLYDSCNKIYSVKHSLHYVSFLCFICLVFTSRLAKFIITYNI